MTETNGAPGEEHRETTKGKKPIQDEGPARSEAQRGDRPERRRMSTACNRFRGGT